MLLIAVLTALAGEFKFMPFEGEAFRFGLGSAVFFFLLLIRQPASYILTSLSTGMVVLLFRMFEDAIWGSVMPMLSMITHFPAFIFYLLYGSILGVIPIEKYKSDPLKLGAITAGIEFLANMAEHLLRKWIIIESLPYGEEWYMLIGVALFRSYFVVGFFSILKISYQQKRLEQMLKVGSSLYGETLYLKKSMDQIETIMASSYDLYRKLKEVNQLECSRKALSIAQEIHEVKKDSQRILAGLSKIYDPELSPILKLSEVLDFVVKGNEKYSQMLNKKISFDLSLSTDILINSYIPLLTILNNLTANAVESIEDEGKVTIEVGEVQNTTWFLIKDNGKGISEQDLELIFEPGYTTKYNDKGVAATGIGLSHVKEIVQNLDGEIKVSSSPDGTIFQVGFPTNRLRRGI